MPGAPHRLLLTSIVVLLLIASLALVVIAVAAGAARADGPVGADPSQNFLPGPLPPTCDLNPTTPPCVDAAVGELNQARASLGQGPYGLPSNFDTLAPEQQMFVLTNLDRVLYGLTPIPGLTAALGQDAAQGVQADTDPAPSDPDVISYTSNWAGGFQSAPLAYEAWMYDDGPGSGNLDCTTADASGCWGHRHDILWRFDSPGPLAMGAAVGQGQLGRPGYAMLLVQGDDQYKPAFTYTWQDAVANGARPAGAPLATVAAKAPRRAPSAPPRTAAPRFIEVKASGHNLRAEITAPKGALLQCALTPQTARGWGRDRWRACSSTVVYPAVPRGRYRLRVRSRVGGGSRFTAGPTEFVTVR
jgi:hypothetical protein